MSSSTWRVLSGYATYQRTPIRMTSGGKCAPLKLIAIVSLPHEVPLIIERDHTANGLKGKFATEPDIIPLTALSPDERTRALQRYQILQPCLEHGMPLSQRARHHGIPRRTLYDWLAQYRRHGLAGMTRRGRSDRGHHRGLRPELKELIEGLALRKPPPTVTRVHRHVQEVALHNGWPVPNYQRVYRIVKQLAPALVMLAHQGSKAYRTKYDLLCRHEAEKPNDLWQADHTLLDIWVRDGSGPLVRPWLTVIMDDYSRAIAGFRISCEAPSSMQTALTLRQAIWRKSLPQWKSWVFRR